ncbi:SigE family RNA polymerase sigma factor [Asanoa siamensis]|uniref:DNA-directed RNA polymerase sigma-70 factor n=1 Tax=Asanoa siamensis TaxID=926357 RepID=A0ABQ4CZ21_9ACTN|nr:SigE family RNA polymerase sigma factor [Asanoa siamensis]GIF76524.1 DNA-directed RNA polymerase sigma-70 factor [Asanoa siamensis]
MPDAGMVHFDAFVASRLPALYRYGFVLTGTPQDAEDLVQEALVRTGLAWHRVRNKDDPERYVRTTMARLMVDRWRRSTREYPVAEPPDAAVDDRGLQRLHDAAEIDVALRGLPERTRAVLVLRYLDGMADAEIADVLGCRPGTVKSQASRGLARLRHLLRGEEARHGSA